MSNIDIIRAGKDEEYRNSLTEAEREQLPENPAGIIELADEAAQTVAGGLFVLGLQTNESPACGYATKQVFCLRF